MTHQFSAELLEAARERNWGKVEELLNTEHPANCERDEQEDPIAGGRSALYYALISGEFDMAERLYEEGDRLDIPLQNCSDDFSGNDSIPGNLILQFISHESARGRDYFFDATRTLEECCRYALFPQATALLQNATDDEIADALAALPASLIRQKSIVEFWHFCRKLLNRGAASVLKRKSPEEFRELLESLSRIAAWPKPIAVNNPGLLKIAAERIRDAAE